MTDLPTLIGCIAGVCVSLGAIFYSIRKTIRFIQKASNGFDAITSLSEEIKPGDFTEFRDHVMHELSPNSGGSLKDQVTRLEAKATSTEDKLTKHIENAALHNTGPNTQIQINPPESN